MTSIIRSINRYKAKSTKPLVDQQIAYVPMVVDDQIECTVQSYLIDGNRHIINQATQLCFKLRYLNFKYMPPRKFIKYKSGIWKLKYLVDNEVIYPFAIFINGAFIPWEAIDLAIGQDNYYLLIDFSNIQAQKHLIHDIKYAQIMHLPGSMRYVSNPVEAYDDDTVFTFDENGLYSLDSYVYSFKLNSDFAHIIFDHYETIEGVNALKIFNDTSIKVTGNNVVLFINGQLATGNKDNIVRGFDTEYIQNGVCVSYIDLKKSDEDIGSNPNIKFDSTLLTIGDGTNTNGDLYNFSVFVNTDYTYTVDNINRTEPDALAPVIQDQNSGANNPQYLQDLQIPFEFAMDRSKNYDTNVAEAIKTILTYNSSLFNSVYLEKSNLIIEEYTGQEILDKVKPDGTVVFSRQHNHMIEEFMIVLVNGELYKYHYMCKTATNKFIVPIQGINPDDAVELMRFKRNCNFVGDLTVNKDDGFRPFAKHIINENTMLFCTESHEDHYDYPYDGLQHFPVEFTYERDDNDNVKITFANDFYYGKPLKLAFKNRYAHHSIVLATDSTDYKINLSDKFMYCNDYTKYFIFHNGRRLYNDHYRLTLPVRPGTPFYDFNLYLTMPMMAGDRIDIVYVPSLMQDIIMRDELPASGDIVIDKSVLNYGISTDLYMVWINGKKISNSHIRDIDSTHMRLITDEQTTKTVCVTKYIPDIDVFTEVFKDNEALWDKVMAQLTNEEIYALLGIAGEELTNTEEEHYANAVHVSAIMYEIIRDQFMANPRVDVTGPFVYDYQDVDKTAIVGTDAGGNAVLPVSDANRSDNLDNVVRQWP